MKLNKNLKYWRKRKKITKILNSKTLQRNEINKEYEEVIYQFGDNSKFGKGKQY